MRAITWVTGCHSLPSPGSSVQPKAEPPLVQVVAGLQSSAWPPWPAGDQPPSPAPSLEPAEAVKEFTVAAFGCEAPMSCAQMPVEGSLYARV